MNAANLTPLHRAILREVAPRLFAHQKFDNMETWQEAILEIVVAHGLVPAMRRLNRTQFHVDELLGDDFQEALFSCASFGLLARMPTIAPVSGTNNFRAVSGRGRKRNGHYIFCYWCGLPKYARASFLRKQWVRYCSRECAGFDGWSRKSGRKGGLQYAANLRLRAATEAKG